MHISRRHERRVRDGACRCFANAVDVVCTKMAAHPSKVRAAISQSFLMYVSLLLLRASLLMLGEYRIDDAVEAHMVHVGDACDVALDVPNGSPNPVVHQVMVACIEHICRVEVVAVFLDKPLAIIDVCRIRCVVIMHGVRLADLILGYEAVGD